MLKKQMGAFARAAGRKQSVAAGGGGGEKSGGGGGGPAAAFSKQQSKSLPDVTTLDGGTEEAIRVCTRMRPLFQKEIDGGHLKAWKVDEKDLHLVIDPPTSAEMAEAQKGKKGRGGKTPTSPVSGTEKSAGQESVTRRHYAFDRCFDMEADNSEVYEYVAMDIVLDTFKGINGACMAYGQTGSGKTHSIMGTANDPGILPRSLADFFDVISNPALLEEDEGDTSHSDTESSQSDGTNNQDTEFLMRITYVEIYMERVNDLLQDGPGGPTSPVENLDVKEDPKKGFFVVGLHEETVASMEEVMKVIARAEQKRHFARTNFNETSSRSHTVFTVILESSKILPDGTSISRKGELKIVDLAGNERAGKASEGFGEASKTILEEGKAINKSLFLLSEVISKLSRKAQMASSADDKKPQKGKDEVVFIPWRDSKLTRILSKSLGGNCRASVIVAVHPSHLYLDTSFSTLRFATKCKTIKKKIHVNYLSPEQSVIMQQKELIDKLQEQLKKISKAAGREIDGEIDLTGFLPAEAPKAAISPEDDEKVQELRYELEKKIKKFQSFIMRSPIPETPLERGFSRGGAGGAAGPGGFKRSRTMSVTKHRLSRIGSVAPPPMEGVAGGETLYVKDAGASEKRVSMVTAINFLKNINELTAEADEEALLKEDTMQSVDSQLSRCMTLGSLAGDLDLVYRLEQEEKEKEEREAQEKKEEGEEEEEEEGEERKEKKTPRADDRGPLMAVSISLNIVNKLKNKLYEERQAKRKVKSKNNELASQAKFINALMQKLGLSVLTTGVSPTPCVPKEEKSSLSLNEDLSQSAVRGFSGSLAVDSTEIKPLAYAMLNRTLTRAMLRAFRSEEESITGGGGGGTGEEGGGVGIASLTTETCLTSTTSRSDLLPAVEKVLSHIGGGEISSEGISGDNEKYLQAIEGKKQKILDSILCLLTPWEQQMLVLLYEQQEMRKCMQQLREHFNEQLREFNSTIRRLSIEKLELSEHCERLLAEVWNYRQHLEASGDKDSNAKFARLMQKLEELSIQNAEKNTEYQLLTEEFVKVKEENVRLQDSVKILLEENRAYFMSPESLPFMEEINSISDKEKQQLARSLLMLQAKLSDSRLRYEELRAVEGDMRRLNASLYTELVRANETIKDIRSQLKLTEFTIKKERKMTAEQLQKALEDENVQIKKIQALEEKLAAAENRVKELEEAAAVKAHPPKDELADEMPPVVSEKDKESEEQEKEASTSETETKLSTQTAKPKPKAAKAKTKAKAKAKAKTKLEPPERTVLKKSLAGSKAKAKSKVGGAAAAINKPSSAAAKDEEAQKKKEEEERKAEEEKKLQEEKRIEEERKAEEEKKTEEPPSEFPPEQPKAGVPAFKGDPRDKGFLNMANAISNRKRLTRKK